MYCSRHILSHCCAALRLGDDAMLLCIVAPRFSAIGYISSMYHFSFEEIYIFNVTLVFCVDQRQHPKGSRMVRELFVMAREAAPSIIFMDEIDSIGSSRVEGSEGGDSEVQRTMLELLNQLDGFEPTQNIKVCACGVILGIVAGVCGASIVVLAVVIDASGGGGGGGLVGADVHGVAVSLSSSRSSLFGLSTRVTCDMYGEVNTTRNARVMCVYMLMSFSCTVRTKQRHLEFSQSSQHGASCRRRWKKVSALC